MIKRITILTRKSGMSKEEFLRHWKDHLPIAHAVPEMRRYVINHILSQPQRPDIPVAWDMGEVDGIAETWWDNQESTDRAFASEAGKRWLAHGASFIGRQKTFIVEEEHVVG